MLCWLGTISFSTYLLHRVVIETMTGKNWMIPLLVVAGTPNYLLNVCLIAIPVTIALSCLTFAVIEKPFLDLRVRYKRELPKSELRQAA